MMGNGLLVFAHLHLLLIAALTPKIANTGYGPILGTRKPGVSMPAKRGVKP